ncbi:hypothetical protein ACL9RL_18010 [Plantibacter sp. Mn2098]|uniref:hypothetical protein n=1 Tax=Plantibacter sp. Mn2098 TaxID=3395266 RepID=UPI003BDA60EA
MIRNPLTSSRSAHRLFVAVSAAVLVAPLSGCSTASGPTKSAEPHSAQAADDWQLKFAACMRDQGIDYPDPAPGGGESGSFSGDASDFQTTQDARDKCTQELGPMPEPKGPMIRADDISAAEKKTAKCLRDNGVDVADPRSGESIKLPADAPQEIIKQCLRAGR